MKDIFTFKFSTSSMFLKVKIMTMLVIEINN